MKKTVSFLILTFCMLALLSVVASAVPVPGIEVVKDCPPEFAYVGDTLTYNYTVNNTGDGALLDVTLVDDLLGSITLISLTDVDADGSEDDLAVGAFATGTADYLVLEGDTVLVNTATASSSTIGIDELPVEATSNECMVEICYDETAWAKRSEGATANNTVAGNKSNAWGWTNQFTEDDTYVMDLWAAAGQNDTSKGILVGTVTVVVAGGCVTVDYLITNTDQDYIITEAHLWVGNTELPLVGKKLVPTAAPGQFPYSPEIAADGLSASWTDCGFEFPVWVAAHAVIEWCGLPELQ